MPSKKKKRMAGKTKLIQIIRKVGAPEVPKIKLTGILESPEQDLFSFSYGKNSVLRNILEHLGNSSINIRFMSKSSYANNHATARICIDSKYHEKVKEILSRKDVITSIDRLIYQPGVRILSIYPFKGDPKIAMRFFDALNSKNIEVLATNTATSVISCVIPSRKLPLAKQQLKSAFTFG